MKLHACMGITRFYINKNKRYNNMKNNYKFVLIYLLLFVGQWAFGEKVTQKVHFSHTELKYNTITGEITPVDSSFSVPVIELTDRYDQEQAEYLSSLGREFGYGRKEDYEVSKEKHKTEKSSYNFWKGKPDYNREDANNKV